MTQTFSPPHIVVEPAPVQLVVGTRQQLKEQLLAHLKAGHDVVLDFSTARYIDSSGLGVLVSLKKHFSDAGRRFVIAALDEDLAMLFELTKMDSILRPYPTVEEAAAAIRNKAA